MALEITVGPPRLTLNHGRTFLVSDQDCQIRWPSDNGLYASDTRLISSWRIYANGEPWDLLNSANISAYAGRAFLLNRAFATEDGMVDGGSVALMIGRCLSGGMHEDLDLVNHGQKTARFNLEIAIRSDFADLFEVKTGNIVRRGRIKSQWSEGRGQLSATYDNRDFHRRVRIQVREADAQASYANGRLSFGVEIEPGATWHACLLYEFTEDHRVLRAPASCVDHTQESSAARHLDVWRASALKVRSSDERFSRFYQQSIEDIAALRLPLRGTGHREFVPAAGVPWFVGLFGRDSLIVSLQNGIIYPDFARGVLDVLGRRQALERDDYRDAEPGKIMHELRTGELAHFKLIPHTPYYGTADATPLYLIALHDAWRCTGDDRLLEQHAETADRCLAWIDDYGDRDGDGFQEYETRSPQGYENQGWKDSGDSVVWPDGSLVKGPKALCELQGYVYDAWLRMAEIFDARGLPDRAAALRGKAADLFERFNDVFWDEASGFYAFALDGEKRPVLSVASNPGHCLWSGIVPPERAGRVVARLMADDMWTGWGIRTLSSRHPAYSPHAYHNGSVWPHDNGLIALGFRRYGFTREAAQVANGIVEAADYFMQHRMPELYAGLGRSPTTFPVQYKGANVPQAWAAGSCFSLLQAIVGLRLDAPNNKVLIDPVLPDWMSELTIDDLKLGRKSLALRLWRDGAATRWTVTRGDPSLFEQRSFVTGPCGNTDASPAVSEGAKPAAEKAL